MTVRAHDLMPMFTASGADGTLFRYEDIWQRTNQGVVGSSTTRLPVLLEVDLVLTQPRGAHDHDMRPREES